MPKPHRLASFTLAALAAASAFVPSAADAAIIIGNVSSGTSESASILTVSHTAAAGLDRVLVAGVTVKDNDANFTATYGGAAMTLIRQQNQDNTSGTRSALFFINLGNSTVASTANIVFNRGAGGPTQIRGGAIGIQGAEQTGADSSNVNGNSGTGLTGSAVIVNPQEIGSAIIDIIGTANSTELTPGANQTERWEQPAAAANNTRGAMSSRVTTTSGVKTNTWSFAANGGTQRYSTVIAAFGPADADIALSGNPAGLPVGVDIADDDTSPSLLDGTDFGVALAGMPISRTFRIDNTGDGTLQLGSITLPTGFTLLSPFTPGQLVARNGGFTTFDVQLDAAAAGTFSGDIVIANNTPGSEGTFNFAVTGTVIPEPASLALLGLGSLLLISRRRVS